MFISRSSHVACLSVLATFVAAAATAPGASAAEQRYASPGGAGSACSAATPCSIVNAVGGAKLDDEVILSPGDYLLAGPLADTRRITIHGVAGQPRPRLLFNAPNQDGLRLEFGSTLRYVEIDQTAANGNALFTANGVTVDQVIAKAPGIGDPAANVQNSTIRNSIAVASAPNGRALVTDAGGGVNTSTYRNVTAIATASGGVAIEASASNVTGKATIHLVNVLARAPSGISLRAHTDNSGATATITATHTNYQSGLWEGAGAGFVDGGGNPQEEPVFTNPAAGDYHQAAGALWTIDAGLDAAANGEFDVDGDPRQIGKTDIGADEFVPPPAAPTPATPTAPANPPTHSFAGVRLVSTRLTLAGRFIRVRLSCPAGTAGRCSGRTKLTARRGRTGSRAATRVTLGRAGFSIAAGKRATVKVRVSRAGRRLLARTRRLSGRAANAAHSDAGQSKRTVTAVTIRRRTP